MEELDHEPGEEDNADEEEKEGMTLVRKKSRRR